MEEWAEEKLIPILNTSETLINLGGAQPMAGAVQDLEDSATLHWYAEARSGWCQMMTKDEQLMKQSKTKR